MSSSSSKVLDEDEEELDLTLSFPTNTKSVTIKASDCTDSVSDSTEDDRLAKISQAFKTIIEVKTISSTFAM